MESSLDGLCRKNLADWPLFIHSHWTDVLKANHFALIERAERPQTMETGGAVQAFGWLCA